MTSLLSRPRALFPGLTDLFDTPWPLANHNQVRVEESIEDGRYLIRAELPGLDPDTDIRVSAEHGMLTINAEREDRSERKGRSEFRYGAFTRSITLPQDVDPTRITASYRDGILEVAAPYTPATQTEPITIDVNKDRP